MCRSIRIVWLISGLLVSGCAGLAPAQVGQTVGTIAGAVVAPGLGAPLGSLAGLLAGLLVQGEVDKVVARRERTELGQQFEAKPVQPQDGQPPLGAPTRVWVDETFQNGRLIPAHFDVRAL